MKCTSVGKEADGRASWSRQLGCPAVLLSRAVGRQSGFVAEGRRGRRQRWRRDGRAGRELRAQPGHRVAAALHAGDPRPGGQRPCLGTLEPGAGTGRHRALRRVRRRAPRRARGARERGPPGRRDRRARRAPPRVADLRRRGRSRRTIVSASWSGQPVSLHATSTGKVVLAWSTEEELARLMPRRLKRYTDTHHHRPRRACAPTSTCTPRARATPPATASSTCPRGVSRRRSSTAPAGCSRC